MDGGEAAVGYESIQEIQGRKDKGRKAQLGQCPESVLQS